MPASKGAAAWIPIAICALLCVAKAGAFASEAEGYEAPVRRRAQGSGGYRAPVDERHANEDHNDEHQAARGGYGEDRHYKTAADRRHNLDGDYPGYSQQPGHGGDSAYRYPDYPHHHDYHELKPRKLPNPVMSVSLNYASSRYLMNMGIGINDQRVSLVFDTGSGSLYIDGYNASASATAQATDIHRLFGYGSGAVEGNTFYKDSISIPGSKWGTQEPLTLKAPQFNWIATQAYVSPPNPIRTGSIDKQGLVGWSPAGWNMAGTGKANEPKSIAGSVCPKVSSCRSATGSSACRGPVLADLLVPCNNVPTVFEAFVAAGALSKRQNMFSIYINKDTSTNGGHDVGTLLLGGADPSLSTGSFVTTPLQPNLWRTDFLTGEKVFVFWQFTPRRISVVDNQGTSTTLCSKDDLESKEACTVIADTGYDAMVVTQDKPREALEALLHDDQTVCAMYLKVELPTSPSATRFKTLTIPLTADGSTNCTQLLLHPSNISPAPEKFVKAGVLPTNWFVFGQPILQQLYSVFDFSAFEGRGALHFALAKKAPTPSAKTT